MPIDERAERDHFVRQFFARIPPELRSTYTTTQLAALKMVFGDTMRSGHAVDLRLVFPPFLTRKRFYFVFVSGRDRRGGDRLRRRRRRRIVRALRRLVKLLAMCLIGILLVLAALFILT